MAERGENITLLDDEGKAHEFTLVDVIEVASQRYAVLQPEDPDEGAVLFRVDGETLHYQFTVDDPATYVKPWTAMIPMKPAPGTGRIYEFACHEGNHGMVGILAGHRAQEKRAPPVRTGSR